MIAEGTKEPREALKSQQSGRQNVTSAHRVAGSSHAGCKAIPRADPLAIDPIKKTRAKKAAIGFLSDFGVLRPIPRFGESIVLSTP
jgi:hypothetical protein